MIWKPTLHTGPIPTQRPFRQHSGKDCKRGPSWIYMVNEKKGAILLSLLHNNKAKYFLAWRSSWKKKLTYEGDIFHYKVLDNFLFVKSSWKTSFLTSFHDMVCFQIVQISQRLSYRVHSKLLRGIIDCRIAVFQKFFFFSLSLSIFIYWTLEAFFS